jgi:hypothetical protein
VVAERAEERHAQALELVAEAQELLVGAELGEIAVEDHEAHVALGVDEAVDVLHAADGFLHVGEGHEAEGAGRVDVGWRHHSAARRPPRGA